ncbi:hypothetical protein PENTCL1PPCAC_23709, partial [Pristionchus entomophagus]
EDIAKLFSIESARRKRCRDNEECKGHEQKDEGPIHYQHISRNNQVVDLEAILSAEWMPEEGETEPRHCSNCCECCRVAEEGHDEDKCDGCKKDRRHYVEEQSFQFKGDSKYALVAFNILQYTEKVDWALAPNCDLNNMKLMGREWKAVAMIKHIGSSWGGWSRGHYVAYTRQDDDKWWIHDDDARPYSIGSEYKHRSGYSLYPEGATDMAGVQAILFEERFTTGKLDGDVVV